MRIELPVRRNVVYLLREDDGNYTLNRCGTRLVAYRFLSHQIASPSRRATLPLQRWHLVTQLAQQFESPTAGKLNATFFRIYSLQRDLAHRQTLRRHSVLKSENDWSALHLSLWFSYAWQPPWLCFFASALWSRRQSGGTSLC